MSLRNVGKNEKRILSLLICAIVSSTAWADTVPQATLAEEGVAYDAIIVKLKPSTDTGVQPSLTLSDPSLAATAMYPADKNTTEMAAINKRYGFDRYLRINLPGDKNQDKNYINSIISELEHNQNIEAVYPESLPVSLEEEQGENSAVRPGLRASSGSLGAVSVPDFRHLQDYLKAPDEKRAGYFMGGVNRDSVNLYKGNEGEDMVMTPTY